MFLIYGSLIQNRYLRNFETRKLFVNSVYKPGFLLTEIMIAFSIFMICITLYAQMQWRLSNTERTAFDYLYALTLAKNSIEEIRISSKNNSEEMNKGQFVVKQKITPLLLSKNDNAASCYKIVVTVAKNDKSLISLESAFLKREASL